MKILNVMIVCPWWGRPDIVELHCRSMKKFMLDGVDYLAILSPEDPHLQTLETLCEQYNLKKTYYQNDPLGKKLNHGIRLVDKSKYDYIMNMGSDDLCDIRYWRAIQSFIGKPFFRVDALYIAENKSFNRVWRYRNIFMGALRMIKTDIIKEDIYHAKNKWLDASSRSKLRNLGYEAEVIPSDKIYVIDIKSSDNITKFHRFRKKRGRLVKVNLNRFL